LVCTKCPRPSNYRKAEIGNPCSISGTITSYIPANEARRQIVASLGFCSHGFRTIALPRLSLISIDSHFENRKSHGTLPLQTNKLAFIVIYSCFPTVALRVYFQDEQGGIREGTYPTAGSPSGWGVSKTAIFTAHSSVCYQPEQRPTGEPRARNGCHS
jgi:hypothetical protein